MKRVTSAAIPDQVDQLPTAETHAVAPEKRRRIGRPKRSEPVKVVSLSVPQSVYRSLKHDATLAGLRTASYILSRVTEASSPRIVPALNVEQWDGLRCQLDDLTTVFRRALEAKLMPESAEEKMTEVTEEIRRLRLVLLGIEVKE